jgi:acyl-CoA thioester hydrolase
MQPFYWNLRVYWEDTDAGGVVYHSQYLNFFERTRTEWLRTAGIDQSRLGAHEGIIFVVHSMNIEFSSPARLDDELRISVVLQKMGGATMALEQDMIRIADGMEISRATVRVACLHAGEFTPARIPERIKTEILNGA